MHPDHEDTPRFKNHTVVTSLFNIFSCFTFTFFCPPLVLFFSVFPFSHSLSVSFTLSLSLFFSFSPFLLLLLFVFLPLEFQCCLDCFVSSGLPKRLLDTVVAAPQKAVCTRLVSSVRSRFYRRWQPMCLGTILLCGGVCACAFFWIIPGISHHHVFLHT